LAWLHVTGQWPLHDIDFIDGNPLNVAFENLRDSTNKHVPLPTHLRQTDKTGRLIGARWQSHTDKWQSSILMNGKSLYLGLHDTQEQAHAAYCKALVVKRGASLV
jgi:hypothetical protein